MIKICITGHRKLLYPDTVREQIRSSLEYFQAYYKNNEPITAISAMASGSDTIFAEEALDLGISLKAIFPFAANEYQKDFLPEEWQRVQTVIDNKKCNVEIAHQLIDIAEDARKSAYLATGERLVDEADIVLAVWDGLPPAEKGGTADIIRYTYEKGKELHTIKGLRQPVDGKLPMKDEMQMEFERLDKAAIKYKHWRFQPAWMIGIALGVLAAISFSAGLALKLGEVPGSQRWHHQKFLLAAGEVICLLLSLLLLLNLARRSKTAFLDNRRRAEYLRAVLWFRDAGIPIPPAEPIGYSPGEEIVKKEKEVADLNKGISNLPHARRMTWCLANMQVNYHDEKRIGLFHRRIIWLEHVLLIIKIFFFTIVTANFGLELYEYKDLHFWGHLSYLHPWLIFGWMVLPPMYAALEGIKHFTEWKTHIIKSEKIKEELKKICNNVMKCSDATCVTAKAVSLRNIMELENCDWAEWTVRLNPGGGI